MAVITPPAVADLPLAPDPSDRSTFNARAYPWSVALGPFSTQLQALAANVVLNATDAYNSTLAAASSAAASLADRLLAQQAATTAVNSPGTMATSSSSLTLSAGTKSIVLDQLNKNFGKGQTVIVARTSEPGKQAAAIILDFVPGTGAMQLAMGTPTDSGTFTDWTISIGAAGQQVTRLNYSDRGQLRSMGATPAGILQVEGLGLFSHVLGSTEPDDDESCFATGSGRWLLEAASFDLVHAWLAPVLEVGLNTTFLHGSGMCSLTTVGTNSVASFNIPIAGAEVGDRALLCPPAPMGATLSFYGRVNTSDVVTVYLANGATASGSAMTGTWNVTVFKENT